MIEDSPVGAEAARAAGMKVLGYTGNVEAELLALRSEVNPHTLQTVGKWDFGGKLRSETFTAHPRVDPITGELFFFGYEAGGLCTLDVAYGVADAEGNLVSEQWFEQPYCATIHDFVITEKYAIWPIFPTTADLDRLKAGGAHWAHQQELESWLAIMPRYGKVEEMKWIKGPVGVSVFHEVNAYDDGDLVHIDLCLTDTNAFSFMREAGGIHRDQQSLLERAEVQCVLEPGRERAEQGPCPEVDREPSRGQDEHQGP